MTELCFSGGIACGRCLAHMANIKGYIDRQRGSGCKILGLTRIAVNQRLVGFPDDLPLPVVLEHLRARETWTSKIY